MTRMRVVPLAALALAAGLALTACTNQATPQPAPTATTTPTDTVTSAPATPAIAPTAPATETATATAPPTPAATPTATSTLAGPSCGSLVTAQELYDYDSNYSEVSDSSAAPATCAWTSGSNSSRITLTLAPKSTTTYSGTKIPGYKGTFQVVSGKGTVHATIGSYAVTLASGTFGTVDDALPFLDLFGSDLH